MLFSSELFATEFDSSKRPFFSFYSYASPLFNVISTIQENTIWLAKRSNKTAIQKMAIKAAKEKQKYQSQTESSLAPVTIEPSLSTEVSFFNLSGLLKSWELSWDIFYFDDYDGKSDVNANEELPTYSLAKCNRQKTISNKASAPKTDKRISIGNKEKEVVRQARLYEKKKRKPTNSAKAANTISPALVMELIDEIVNIAMDTPKQEGAIASSEATELPINRDHISTVPSATHEEETLTTQIALVTKYLDELEAANKCFPFFLQIALERENATQKCIKLIEKAQFLLYETETSAPDSILQTEKHNFEENKADFEKNKTAFEHFLQTVLIPYTKKSEAKPNNYWEESMGKILLYNQLLLDEIKIFDSIVRKIDNYL